MNLKDIVSVTGLSGLYKMAGNRSNGLIIEDLDTGKRRFAPARQHQFTPLESIAIFTTTEEDSIELGKVFEKLQSGLEAHPLPEINASSDELRSYFTAVFPEHDEDRVKIADIKKVVKWFAFLKERDLLKPDEAEEVEGESPEEE